MTSTSPHSESPTPTPNHMLDAIFQAATRHAAANDDVAYEVGDLQDTLKAAWNLLTPKQQLAVFDDTMQSFGAHLATRKTNRAFVLGFITVHDETRQRDLFEARAWSVLVSPLPDLPNLYRLREVKKEVFRGKRHENDWNAAKEENTFRGTKPGALVLDFSRITTDYALHGGLAPGLVVEDDNKTFLHPEAWLRPWKSQRPNTGA